MSEQRQGSGPGFGRRVLDVLFSGLPGEPGTPRRVRFVAWAVLVTVGITAGLCVGYFWIGAEQRAELAPPHKDAEASAEDDAQDRLDRKQAPFQVRGVRYDWSYQDKEVWAWALDRKFTAAEAEQLERLGEHTFRRPSGGADPEKALRDWLRSKGARPILTGDQCDGVRGCYHPAQGMAAVQVTLKGTRDKPVTITDFEARLDRKSCRPSAAVTIIDRATAGSQSVKGLTFNLEEQPAPAWTKATPDAEAAKYTDAQYESLSVNEPDSRLKFEAVWNGGSRWTGGSRDQVCDWVIDATYEASDKQDTLTIDDHGKPFRVESAADYEERWTLGIGETFRCTKAKPTTATPDQACDPRS
ncbi:hypothetical protein G5C51_03125 [Streptomyces sp. A7024]|uniref:Uncharacterized protein n=1 Tax=Streptomyces coryli TaxID=1128680 RepID=A0A6G4TTV6_9ACTN|nr:hypothetical protein [Streptomyces coryli]NGN62896.1 hypothetical protein [Streptomyces coryli]